MPAEIQYKILQILPLPCSGSDIEKSVIELENAEFVNIELKNPTTTTVPEKVSTELLPPLLYIQRE